MTHASNTKINQEILDPRIYCDYTRLVKLKTNIDGFSFFPYLKTSRQLSGRHLSKYRGRGLNFDELRHYHLGDDIRNLDWKVTLRTGKPHVRSYTKEKDHNVILCVDQRSSLFFSSIDTMKSVIAAELASLCAWRVVKESDRVGFFLINDKNTEWMPPKRSQNDVLKYLKKLAAINQSLQVNTKEKHSISFSNALHSLNRRNLKNSIIIIFSDWVNITEEDVSLLKHLQKYNDILSILISDPMDSSLMATPSSKWVLSNGIHQINLEKRQDIIKANYHLEKTYQNRCEALRQLMAIKRLPFMEVSTAGNHISQFTRLLRAR
ncbi:DUF58 domain-containing protein [Aliivibrio fischeri]|uniref:DUF58 domain-containing protein n=1 Tax=Aliivibrio fischeri TaxID=668 RepID=A0A6N3Z349_ALIFS|nr:DUF58 domain-containing protein [Aliivibrio fischeri]MUK44940.1 DUF58 domain-containing protein [Aliivibrio fischeri]MUK61736.1 DUF58 domain-containing protein [Aliivibrio fischeri]MUK80599.1 DUF58 domain-containing protein [Aliivibrio fischeri]MUK84392.1 DUF58 domain-containing protein [Aliivibrio fischeri]MUL21993.1 DUF58 domain-containing protein [Aliivibrio fischeri]